VDVTLTVILLTYNHEDTVARALDSVLSQATSYRYQIWICEDCSSDNTARICRDYAKAFPETITLIAQRVNTKGRHFKDALCRIDTPYLAVLEGDDYWCHDEKIQIGLDVLERHAEYVTFAHDTLYEHVADGTQQSLVRQIHSVEIQNPVSFERAPYLHTSARIHRNVVDFRQYRKRSMLYDIYLFYLFMDKGSLYYCDKVMSVYRITGSGMWSSLGEEERGRRTEVTFYRLNRLLSYKYDSFFSEKIIRPVRLKMLKRMLGMKVGWTSYVVLRRLRIT
jgi:glycosyltransferase involved in cell wall biosynthesis